jgi:peptidase M28-like protein
MLAGSIGSRPVGTPENARARQYVVDQLRLFGYDVRVQETDARRPDFGATARVANIIAVKAGAEKNAIALISHYDSHPAAPGAADDGLGVAVSLEAARVLAAREDRRHTLFVLVTDGEEPGLMGAAGLVTDRGVMDRLQAYINVEATGSGGTAMLFEAGPGNGWIVKPWARSAPHPRGASFAVEIYHRLPNDTDFSILKRRDVPGLNFAAIGDSYPYHTARDTPDRLSDVTLRNTGENAVETAIALDALDLSTRSAADQTFVDVGQVVAVSWGPVTAWFIAALSLGCGLLAWFKALGASVRLVGLGRWILDAVWALAGAAAVAGAMIGGTWLLRAARTVYHPWYARPERMFLLLLALGLLAGWLAVRLGALLPKRAHGPRHPILVWSLALPLWVLLAGVTAAFFPGAGYLWTLPLLVAGIGLLAVPATNMPAIRAVSVVVLAVAGTLWLRDTAELLRFMVALLGRMPFVTPVWVYAALMLACGVMVVPPFVAAVAATKPLLRPSLVSAVLLVAVVVTAGLAYAAPAYTFDQPQRRYLRVMTEPGAATSTYEVGSQEPGLDLDASAPGGWYRATDVPKTSVPFGRFGPVYVFRTSAPSPGPAPGTVGVFTLKQVAAGTELTMTIVPQAPGLTAAFVLPEGVAPSRSNLPGTVVRGRWRAVYIAVPADGVTWRASFKTGVESRLPATQAVIWSARVPGGSGWQSLPAWLPQEHAVWDVNVAWILAPPAVIAPVAPLR